jgi:hypothetical protein
MTFRKTVVTLLVLTTLPIAVRFLASPATAQSPRTAVPVGQLLITTSTLITVEPGETFQTGGVRVPPCPKGTSFLATAVQAAPYLATFGGNVVSLPKWAVSVHVFQVTFNGSFSPRLTAFADGPEQASTSIPGGQPLAPDEDTNVEVRLLGNAAAVHTPFAVHVTGYCGVPFVTPA